ncbi:hypothetical protein C8J57DRAFT_1246464 [Mycena rebaudengoi]|nr:hypothetical protein C8J57DRAFT_1246464 [Mycena rebaudengoi]
MRAIGSRISDEAEPFGNGQDHPHLYRRAHAAKTAGPAGWDEIVSVCEHTAGQPERGANAGVQGPDPKRGAGRKVQSRGPCDWNAGMNTTKVYDEGCKQAQQSPSAAQGGGREAGNRK